MSEFEHYGRLGMKWYQHIFGKEQAQAMYAQRQELRKERKEVRKNPEKFIKDYTKNKIEENNNEIKRVTKIVNNFINPLSKENFLNDKEFRDSRYFKDLNDEEAFNQYQAYMKDNHFMNDLKIFDASYIGELITRNFLLESEDSPYWLRDDIEEHKAFKRKYSLKETFSGDISDKAFIDLIATFSEGYEKNLSEFVLKDLETAKERVEKELRYELGL